MKQQKLSESQKPAENFSTRLRLGDGLVSLFEAVNVNLLGPQYTPNKIALDWFSHCLKKLPLVF